MLKKLQERIFPFIITLSALSVSVSAAYYSVSGLSKLFAGASFEVIIMATSLEISKLVIASLLYQYRKTLSKGLKFYLSTALVVLVLITSMGIYGFLSSAYQETASKSGTIDAQVALVETKRDNIKEQLNVYVGEKETINKAVGDLRSGLSNNVIQYTNSEGVLVTTTSSATRKSLEKQLDQSLERQNIINAKVDDLNTKLFEYETEIVEISTNNELAGELGPLKYLSGLTGVSMDKIINILLLVIIFVFDPLAIALVISANYAFEQLKRKTKENLYGEIIPVEAQVEDIEKIVEPYDTPQDEINDWNNTLQDGLDNIPYEESEEYKRKIEKENELLTTSSVSGWRKKKILKERKKRDDDGLSKVY
jgi:cell division protein FtsB